MTTLDDATTTPAGRSLLRLILDPAQILYRSLPPGAVPDPWQLDLLRGQPEPGRPRRVAALTSRQVGKSTATASLAVWYALIKRCDVLVIAPSIPQASELVRKCRAQLQAMDIPTVRDAATSLTLPGGGRILARGGTPTAARSYSPLVAIADEACWVRNDTFAALLPVLSRQPGGGVLVLLTTAGAPSGFFYDVFTSSDDLWERYEIPWWKSSLNATTVEGFQAILPSSQFRAEFCCEWLDPTGSVFAPDLIDAAMNATTLNLPVITPFSARQAAA